MLQSKYDLSGVKARPILREANLVAQVEKQLTTVEEVRDEVQALARLESEVKLYDEGVCDLLHDVTLYLSVVHLVGADDKVLLERFDSVHSARVFLNGKVDLTKAATADDFLQSEVFYGQVALLAV